MSSVTPFRIALCEVLRLYSGARNQFEEVASLPLPRTTRLKLALFVLQQTRLSDSFLEPSLPDLLQRLDKALGLDGPTVSSHLHLLLSKFRSPDDLCTAMAGLKDALTSGPYTLPSHADVALAAAPGEGNPAAVQLFLIDPHSPLGVYLRKCVAAFNLLPFESVCHLLTGVRRYVRKSTTTAASAGSNLQESRRSSAHSSSIPPGSGRIESSMSFDSDGDEEMEVEDEMDVEEEEEGSEYPGDGDDDYGGGSGDELDRDEEEPPWMREYRQLPEEKDEEEGRWVGSVAQVDAYLREQGSRIERSDVADISVHSPAHSSARIDPTIPSASVPSSSQDDKSLRLLALDVPRVHFLEHIRSAQKGDYTAALHSLHHFYDFSSGDPQPSSSSSHPPFPSLLGPSSLSHPPSSAPHKPQNAALSRAALETEFGRVPQALASLKETIQVSLQESDDVCLSQALSLLCHLLSSSPSSPHLASLYASPSGSFPPATKGKWKQGAGGSQAENGGHGGTPSKHTKSTAGSAGTAAAQEQAKTVAPSPSPLPETSPKEPVSFHLPTATPTSSSSSPLSTHAALCQLSELLLHCIQRATRLKLPHLVAHARLVLATLEMQHGRSLLSAHSPLPPPSLPGMPFSSPNLPLARTSHPSNSSPAPMMESLRAVTHVLNDAASASILLPPARASATPAPPAAAAAAATAGGGAGAAAAAAAGRSSLTNLALLRGSQSGSVSTSNQNGSAAGQHMQMLNAPAGSMSASLGPLGGFNISAARIVHHPQGVLRLAGASHLSRSSLWLQLGCASLARMHSLVHAICYADVATHAELQCSHSLLARAAAVAAVPEGVLNHQNEPDMPSVSAAFPLPKGQPQEAEIAGLELQFEQCLERYDISSASAIARCLEEDQSATSDSSPATSTLPPASISSSSTASCTRLDCLVRRIRLCILGGMFQQAARYSKSLYRLSWSLCLPSFQTKALLLLAQTFQESGNPAQAVPLLHLALSSSSSFNLLSLRSLVAVTLAECLCALGPHSSHAPHHGTGSLPSPQQQALCLVMDEMPVLAQCGGPHLWARGNLVAAKCTLGTAQTREAVSQKASNLLHFVSSAAAGFDATKDLARASEAYHLLLVTHHALGNVQAEETAAHKWANCVGRRVAPRF